MLRTPCKIWVYPSKGRKFSRAGLARFAFRLRAKRRILVFVQSQVPKKFAKQLERYRRLGLIEVLHIASLRDFYSEEDFAIAEQTQTIAHQLARRFVPSMMSQSGYDFDEDDIDNLCHGMTLRLADRLYAGVRQLLAVLEICQIDRGDLWEDYGNWAFPNLKIEDRWWLNTKRQWPSHIYLVSKAPKFCKRDAESAAFGAFGETTPLTLLFGKGTRPAYIDAAEAIGCAEERLGKRFGAIFELLLSETLEPLRLDDKTICRPIEFFINTKDLGLGPASLRFALPGAESGKTVHARLAKADSDFIPRFGFNPEIWFAILANEAVTATNSALGQIVGFYDRIMNDPHFDEVETLVCSPSRSAFFVPAILGLKQRGVETIEYQAFFWSDHPRYEIRNMDLFICSDAATMKIVEGKYDRSDQNTKLILGPSFSMTKFMTDYAEAISVAPRSKTVRPVGVALQPINTDVFEVACRLIRAAGYEVLCRPHPLQDPAQVEAQFGKYGQIDDGTLVDFIRDTSLVVTGFSNVALQTALVGKTAVCLPVPNLLGLDLADASERIHLCDTLDDLHRYLDRNEQDNQPFEFRDPIDHWCDIRRSETPGQPIVS